ncbi:MAG TPA: DegT/DnrJ/EryC1/StrS family aminotransferase [Terriglobia bacterium]|nr:DegT/DnrJ/EryC1/StrS family aminotransferase [Terriglobia bacterium]
MKVPFVDLGAQHRQVEAELRAAFERVLERSSFILGPEVERFESQFAGYLNVSQCVALNSGTAALQLVLQALEIGPGHEVITVPNTFIATAEAISAVGARPVFVDVDPVSYTMDPALAKRAITPRTRALLPVHLYGQPADMDALIEIARRRHLAVVEDACQAHGAEYNGRKAGSIGTAGCFSFYPSKNLGACGEGGAVATNDPALAARIRLLRNHGSVSKYEHRIPGYNFRLEGLQGAFLAAKLKYLDEWNQRRRVAAKAYDRLLAGSEVATPVEMPYAKHVYHLYVIQSDDRDALRQQLAERGIETGLHYPVPLHLQEAYRSLGHRLGDFPVCESAAQRMLSLPMYPHLPDEAVHYVAGAIQDALSNVAA